MKKNDRGVFRGRMLERRIVVALFGLSVLAGCGEEEPTAPPPDPPRATELSISPPSVTLTTIGETATFTASIADQNGAPFSGTVTWTSDAPQVFTVDANGTVTAVGNGSGTVTAAHANLSATASVTVSANQSPMARGTLDDLALAVGGGPLALLPTGFFEDPDHDVLDLTYTATASDPAIASADVLVDSERHVFVFVTGTAPGSATLTITATDPEGLSADQSVTVTVDDSGFTPSIGIRVENGKIVFTGWLTLVGQCSPPLHNVPHAVGYTFTVNSSKWQSRSDSAAAWTDVADTETTTGQLCPHSSDIPGEYRLVFDLTTVLDEHVAPLTGGYRSENSFVVEDTGGQNQAPVPAGDPPSGYQLSVGGGPVIILPETLFTDPDGDDLTFSATVSDSALFSTRVLVDSVGHVFAVATGVSAGSGTLTITATDPGGLSSGLTLAITIDDTGYTPTPWITVSNGVIHALGTSFSVCLPPFNNLQGPGGHLYTFHSSKWQRRADASAAWTDIEGTERTDGRMCPYSTNVPGDYRITSDVSIAVDPHVPTFRGNYASGNFFTVAGG